MGNAEDGLLCDATVLYYLTTTASTGGTIIPPSGWYSPGAPVTVTATPASGYQFAGFSGALAGMTNPQTLTMNGAASVTAGFTASAAITILSTHSGNFTQGQTGATYLLTVRNAGAISTSGTVIVSESFPTGLIPTSMAGAGWTCDLTTCTRSDPLSGGSSYPAITVTVNVAPNAASQVTNQATVSGGGSAAATASDLTAIDPLLRYSNPLAFATSASVVGGVPTILSVTYTNDNGPTDIASGQVKIDDCYLAWDRSGHILLYGANGGGQVNGYLGQSATLWVGNCSINLADSSLSTPTGNPKALVLTLDITFPEQAYPSTDDRNPSPDFVGPHEVHAWGTSAGGLATGQVDLGSLVVSQGQDFTLTLGASESMVNLGTGATLSLTLAATGLNGFNGSIALGTQAIGGSGACFGALWPASIQANTQTTITVRNNGCQNGAYLNLTVDGSAIGIRRSTSAVTLYSAATGDFNIGVGAPTPSVLMPQSSVSYPVIVSSSNGQTGYVSLSLNASGIPAGVSGSFSPAQVYLSGSESTATSYLTLYGSAGTPPGTYTLQVAGMLGSTQHTAILSLSTQVTTFQVTSATGSAIVHNTGQEVQVTHNVPAGNAPTYTTCGTADPKVTCRVISSSPGTVTLGITASTGAVHGTRRLSLNGAATTVHAAISDSWQAGGSSGLVVQAGGPPKGQWLSVPSTYCELGGYCGSMEVESNTGWINGSGGDGNVYVFANPPRDTTPGKYWFYVNMCAANWDLWSDESCDVGPWSVEVTAAPPQCTPIVGIVFHGSTTDIAGSQRSVSGGQLVLLDSSILNSCSQAATQYSWTIDGSIVSDWQGVGADGKPSGSPPDENSAGPPSTPVLDAQGVTFAWTDGGTGKKAAITVTFADGSTATAFVTFDISIPAANASMGAGNVYVNRSSGGFPGKFALYFTMVFAFTNPRAPDGDYEWVQVLNNSVITRHDSTGTYRQTISGLDTTYPYVPLNDTGPSDQPATLLQVGYDQYTRSDDFTMYLMFRPSAAALGSTARPNIWIPLNGYEWKWGGSAQSLDGGNTWMIVPNSAFSDPTASLADLPRLKIYPTWTANAQNQVKKNEWVRE